MITMEQWKEAANHLNEMIKSYFEMESVARIRLEYILIPLRERFNSGERTEELYEQIMACR